MVVAARLFGPVKRLWNHEVAMIKGTTKAPMRSDPRQSCQVIRRRATTDSTISVQKRMMLTFRVIDVPRLTTKKSGGADRDRTGGLLVANQALSQLSYSPFTTVASFQLPVASRTYWELAAGNWPLILVGLGRIELPTSPLSGVRSSQLSYRPGLSP